MAMTEKGKPNVAIFVDVQNIYYTTKQAYQRQFNYRAFWQRMAQQANILMANAYAIESADLGQQKFQTALKHIGFNVKLKPYIQRSDGSAKGDWDVGITLDVVHVASANQDNKQRHIDYVVLLSGDGDFELLLRYVRDQYQVGSHVYGVPKLTAASVMNAADRFCSIDDSLLL